MKYFSPLVLAVFCCFFTANFFGQSTVQISGQLDDVQSQPIVLGYYLGNKQYIKDTVQVDAKGKFAFTYPERIETGVYILVLPDKKNDYVDFIISEDQQFSFKGKFSDFTKTATFTGSTENTLFYSHLNELEIFSKKDAKWSAVKSRHGVNGNIDSLKMADEALQQNNNAYQKYRKEFIEKNSNTFFGKLMRFSQRPEIPETITDQNEQYYYYKNHVFDNLDWSFDAVLRSPHYQNLLTEFIDRLTFQSPDSIIVACDFICKKPKKTMSYSSIHSSNY